jgi:hypothetical protein
VYQECVHRASADPLNFTLTPIEDHAASSASVDSSGGVGNIGFGSAAATILHNHVMNPENSENQSTENISSREVAIYDDENGLGRIEQSDVMDVVDSPRSHQYNTRHKNSATTSTSASTSTFTDGDDTAAGAPDTLGSFGKGGGKGSSKSNSKDNNKPSSE